MALPGFLITEMRLAFRSCAQQHSSSRLRFLSSTTIRKKDPFKKESPKLSNNESLIPKEPSNTAEEYGEHSRPAQDRTDLATQDLGKKAVGADRRVPVPLKVIPKAQLSPQVHLTPRQRLHVEMLTRRPNVGVEKKIFRERIQIYHTGSYKESMLILLKMTSIVCACAVTFVVAPAHLSAGTPLWQVALIWLSGFVPGFTVNYMTRSWVNRIFLDLPEKARESPKEAMEYAKHLPRDATIDIRYLKPWGLEGSTSGSTSEFVPTRGNLIKPLTFTWRDKQRSSRWVPDSFFVQSRTATGKQSVDTIPGIWEAVYNQIVREPGKQPQKWQSRVESHEE